MIRIVFFSLVVTTVTSQSLYQLPKNTETKVSTFENLNGAKGNGAKTNQGGKGNAFEFLKKGESKTLLDLPGQGIVQRIWITLNRSPRILRSMRLRMFWDGEQKPAIDVPLGDFFGYNLGQGVPYESAFFSSGEGRSFNCFIPMPFRKSARITVTNEGDELIKFFFDVDVVLTPVPADALYLHAYWSRPITNLGDDFVLLPKVHGKGRFLGASFGLNTDAIYGRENGWSEGEVKMFIDGDSQYPTYAGTGTEDYIGSAWGLGRFVNQFQGCTIANDSTGEYVFYRWHVPDAIYFQQDIQVTIQQLGGGMTTDIKAAYARGAKLKPVSVETPQGFNRILDMKNFPALTDAAFPDGWVCFYRVDDYNATSLFYLDKPSNNLPPLQSIETRTRGMK